MPHTRVTNHSTNHRRWHVFAPLGLALIGLGASLLGYSIQIKTEGIGTLSWFIWGTVSLVVLNSGVAVFGEAVKARVLYEIAGIRNQE